MENLGWSLSVPAPPNTRGPPNGGAWMERHMCSVICLVAYFIFFLEERKLAVAPVDISASSPKHAWSTADFEIGRPLGRGAFGRVYLARTKKEHFIVALKILHKKVLTEHRCENNIRREIEINARLCHPNILRMYGVFWDERSIYLVLEYAPNGELYKRLMTKGSFGEKEAATVGADLFFQRVPLGDS